MLRGTVLLLAACAVTPALAASPPAPTEAQRELVANACSAGMEAMSPPRAPIRANNARFGRTTQAIVPVKVDIINTVTLDTTDGKTIRCDYVIDPEGNIVLIAAKHDHDIVAYGDRNAEADRFMTAAYAVLDPDKKGAKRLD